MLNSSTTDPNLLPALPGRDIQEGRRHGTLKKYREPKWLKNTWPIVAFGKGAPIEKPIMFGAMHLWKKSELPLLDFRYKSFQEERGSISNWTCQE